MPTCAAHEEILESTDTATICFVIEIIRTRTLLTFMFGPGVGLLGKHRFEVESESDGRSATGRVFGNISSRGS